MNIGELLAIGKDIFSEGKNPNAANTEKLVHDAGEAGLAFAATLPQGSTQEIVIGALSTWAATSANAIGAASTKAEIADILHGLATAADVAADKLEEVKPDPAKPA